MLTLFLFIIGLYIFPLIIAFIFIFDDLRIGIKNENDFNVEDDYRTTWKKAIEELTYSFIPILNWIIAIAFVADVFSNLWNRISLALDRPIIKRKVNNDSV